jgi:hypothetical protein
MTATKPRNLTHAAKLLQAIRDAIPNAEDKSELIPACDAIGFWLAAQKYSKVQHKLQTEAHYLHDRLNGGTGKRGTRILFS